MLQRFTQHFPNSYCIVLSLSELASHNQLDTWAQHFHSRQVVDHLDIQRRKAPLPLTDRNLHECPLDSHSRQKFSSTNLAIPSNPSQHHCTFERKTQKLLDPIGDSQNHHSLGHHRQIRLFDVSYQSHPTCAVHLHSKTQPGPACGSLFLDVFSCPCLYYCLGPWAGCDLALSLTCLTIHECPFATGPEMDCSSSTLVETNTGLLCARFANTNCSIHQTFAVHHMLGLKAESFLHFTFDLCATTLSKVVWLTIKFSTFHRALTSWSNESSLVLVITRKLLGCILVIFSFLGNLYSRAQTGQIEHQKLSHVLCVSILFM